MAKLSQKPADNLFIPKTRKDTFNQVRSAVEDKYGWKLGNFGFAEFNYKNYRNRYRKLSEEQTKATGKNVYIDTRTGQVWDPAYGNQLKSSLNADKKVLVNSSKSMLYGDLGQGIRSNLQKIKIFQAQNRKMDAKLGYGSELGTLNKLLSPTTAEGGKEIDIRRENELNRLDQNIANEKAKLNEINTYTPSANQLRLMAGEGKTNWERNNEVAQQMDGVLQPGNLGRVTLDFNGEVSPQVQQVVNGVTGQGGVEQNQSNASEATPKTDKSVEKVEQSPKDKWLQDTARSPAALAGLDSNMRWEAYQKNQDFQKHRKAGTLDEFARKYPNSETAKKLKNRLKIISHLDLD